jgi:hypothetical protein
MEKSQEVDEKEAVLEARRTTKTKALMVDRDERGIAKGLDDYLGLDNSIDGNSNVINIKYIRKI